MKSLGGTLARSIRNAVGEAPVPMADSRNGGGVSLFGGGHGNSPSNVQSLLAATKMSGACYSVVRRTSNATAGVDWKLYRKADQQQTAYGDNANRDEILTHRALDVMASPNRWLKTWHAYCEAGQQHNDIVGEAWTVFGNDGQPNGRGGYVPSSMWLIPPDRIRPIPDARLYIAGYEYTSPDGGEKLPLPFEAVMPLIVPDPADPFRGLGPIRSILTMLDAERFSAEWNRNFFRNSAEPGGIIEVPTNYSDTDFDSFQKHWQESHRGTNAAHRVAILEGGMKWIPNAASHKDMEFSVLRTASRDAVLEAFGMPGAMIGVSEHVNKANAQTGEVTFARWVLRDRLDRWKDALNQHYLPLFGKTADGLEFDYVDPTPTDDAAETQAVLVRSQAAQILVNAGFDAEEVLETVGLPAMLWEKPETPASSIHFGQPPAPANPPDGQPSEADDAKEMAPA